MKILIAILIVLIIFYYVPFGLYFKAKVSGVKVSLFEIFKLRFRKIPPYLIIDWCKKLSDNNIEFEFKKLVKYYTDGVELDNVVNGLIEANKNHLNLSFEKACEADLENIDI